MIMQVQSSLTRKSSSCLTILECSRKSGPPLPKPGVMHLHDLCAAFSIHFFLQGFHEGRWAISQDALGCGLSMVMEAVIIRDSYKDSPVSAGFPSQDWGSWVAVGHVCMVRERKQPAKPLRTGWHPPAPARLPAKSCLLCSHYTFSRWTWHRWQIHSCVVLGQ